MRNRVRGCDLHAPKSSSMDFSMEVDHVVYFDYNIVDGDDLSSVLSGVDTYNIKKIDDIVIK